MVTDPGEEVGREMIGLVPVAIDETVEAKVAVVVEVMVVEVMLVVSVVVKVMSVAVVGKDILAK